MQFKYTAAAFALSVSLLLCNMPITALASQDISAVEEEEEVITSIPIMTNEIEGWPVGPEVQAVSAILMDAETGAILYAKDIDTAHYPASITKIMTALLALENCTMDEIVTFSQNAVFSIERNSSHIARTTDEQLTMEQCLYALMLESANECANAIAEHISGSVEAFAELMTTRAAELGCTNTSFKNPHGLHDAGHYTTTHDMALITQAALRFEKFREISGAVRYTIPATNKNENELMMNNHHAMISKNRTSKYYDETVFCGKTGYTSDALNTLVTCARRNDMDLICVLMRGPSGTPYVDTKALLDYGEANFSDVSLSTSLAELPESAKDELLTLLPDADLDNAYLAADSFAALTLPDNVTMDDVQISFKTASAADGPASVQVTYSYKDAPLGSMTYVVGSAVTTPEAPEEELPVIEEAPEEEPSSNSLVRIIFICIGVVILLLFLLFAYLAFRIHQANKLRKKRMMERRQRRLAAEEKQRKARQRARMDEMDDDEFDF